MQNLGSDSIKKEHFFKLRIDDGMHVLTSFVNNFFEREPSDLSHSDSFEYKNSTLEIKEVLNNLFSMANELAEIDEGLGVHYFQQLNHIELLLKSISLFNSELVIIEDYVKRGKKLHYPLFEIYHILMSLCEQGDLNFAHKLYNRLRQSINFKQQQIYLIPEDEFYWILLRYNYVLLGILTEQNTLVSELTFEDIVDLLNTLDQEFSKLSLRTNIRLKNILRAILGKKLDIINKLADDKQDLAIDAEAEDVLEIYKNLILSIKNGEIYLEARSFVEKGILGLESFIKDGKILNIEYRVFKNLKIQIQNLIDLNDIDWIKEVRDSLMKNLLLIQSIYSSDELSSTRRIKRLDYLNNLIETLNEI